MRNMSIIIKIEAELIPRSKYQRNRQGDLSTQLTDHDYTTDEEVQKDWDKGHRFRFLNGPPDHWDGFSTYKGDWDNSYVRVWYNEKTQSVILSGNLQCPTCGRIDRNLEPINDWF